jgi:uncharacterized protein YndB with AHSA1/START domain
MSGLQILASEHRMKFTLELTLHKSRADVWRAFDNPENTKVWQPTLVRVETVSGAQGQTGAVSKLTYAEGKGEFSHQQQCQEHFHRSG